MAAAEAGAEAVSPPILAAEASRREALAVLRRAFAAAGVESPALDARILLEHALGLDRSALALRPDEPLGRTGAARLAAAAARRLAREPVARILGEWEFWGLPFALSPATLTPRPDTEAVVEAALVRLAPCAPARVLDLGTGSGCILVAILRERPRVWGVGVDRSAPALATARANAARNGVGGRAGFVASGWGAALAGGFDLVVANPPYIASADIAGLQPEAGRHDPRPALDGGPDGLDAYRAILADAPRLLAADGWLVLEVGAGQAEAVARLGDKAGLVTAERRADLAGRPRALALRRAP